MLSNQGEKYTCSNADCGCEIEVKTGSRLDAASFSGKKVGEIGGVESQASLRASESQTISTPGDYGAQGASGEGVFGTAGKGESATMQGRYGSTTHPAEERSSDEKGGNGTNFTCCCGKQMHRKEQASTARA